MAVFLAALDMVRMDKGPSLSILADLSLDYHNDSSTDNRCRFQSIRSRLHLDRLLLSFRRCRCAIFKVTELVRTLIRSASTPIWGKFSDMFGRKPIILVANIVFLVGSLICALSVNVKMLLAGRVIQGIGGGGLIILANICISDLFSMR